jgi:DNA gyrase inhibitor GyrI
MKISLVVLFSILASFIQPNHVTMNTNSLIETRQFTLSKTWYIIGKNYTGAYDKTSSYLDDVKAALKSKKLSFNELEAVSIYLSDPATERPEELKSFHGFVTKEGIAKDGFVAKELSSGEYITTITKDPASVWNMFGEAYGYAGTHNLKIADDAPVLITTVENKAPLFTLYFRLE